MSTGSTSNLDHRHILEEEDALARSIRLERTKEVSIVTDESRLGADCGGSSGLLHGVVQNDMFKSDVEMKGFDVMESEWPDNKSPNFG